MKLSNEQCKKVIDVLYERCATGQISVDERERLILKVKSNYVIESTIDEEFTFEKTKNKYLFKNEKGIVVSKLNFYEYKIKNFDWVLLANIETKPDYRRRGLAGDLINRVYIDFNKKNKGIYLFVRKENEIAIKLYTKLGFTKVRSYRLKDGDYFIMAKGKADKHQFDNMNFS